MKQTERMLDNLESARVYDQDKESNNKLNGHHRRVQTLNLGPQETGRMSTKPSTANVISDPRNSERNHPLSRAMALNNVNE